jgi:hypothetical protein
MDHAALRALVLETNFAVHGVPVTVTPPSGAPITTRGVWDPTPPVLEGPSYEESRRREPQHVMTFKRSDVPVVQRGMAVIAPELAGGPDVGWRVGGVESLRADHVRVFLVRDPTVVP